MGQHLLDTHTLLWMQDDNPELSQKARKLLADSSNELYVSIVSIWEVVIKKSLGKLELDYEIDDLLQSCLINRITILPLQLSCFTVLEKLPFIHRDPFDRVIAATAIDLNYTLISRDRNLPKYNLKIIW